MRISRSAIGRRPHACLPMFLSAASSASTGTKRNGLSNNRKHASSSRGKNGSPGSSWCRGVAKAGAGNRVIEGDGLPGAAPNTPLSPPPSLASRLRGYSPALMSLGVAVIAHLLLHFTIGITSAGIVFVYLSALLIASWCGYGPGGLILFLAVFVLPYFYRSNFSPGRVDKVTLFVLILVWLGVSRVAADRRRHEQVLRDVAAQLDERVRTNTDMVLHRLAELESLYGQLPVGVCFLDRELKFVRINDKFAALNGAPPDAHFRRPLRELVSSKLADVMEPLLRQVLESG